MGVVDDILFGILWRTSFLSQLAFKGVCRRTCYRFSFPDSLFGLGDLPGCLISYYIGFEVCMELW